VENLEQTGSGKHKPKTHRTYLVDEECYLCGYKRYVEACHIVPRRLGGGFVKENIVYLCPNHHKVLDYGLLNREESLMMEHRVAPLLNKHKENMKVLEYLYFIIGLRQTPPKWMEHLHRMHKQKLENRSWL
jgi:5-methylcytosine-specific restriction endonuclease McrA